MFSCRELDCFLPEDDPDPARRLEELEWNRQVYELQVKVPGMPVQVSILVVYLSPDVVSRK